MGQSRKLEFPGSWGMPLAARLDLPDAAPRAYALFAHCFTCDKDSVAAARISRALAGFGIAVLRFDFTGLGQSGGDFANTGFSSNVEDLVRAADHLRDHGGPPSILIGHSLGGAAVLAAAHRVPEVRAVATIGAPVDPGHVAGLLGERRAEIERCGEAEMRLAGRTFRIRRQFLDDISAQPQAGRIRRLGAALLVLHSPVDKIVGVDNARRIFDAARHPKSFVAIDGADHLLTRRADAESGVDGLAGDEGTFLLCTFWLAQALAMTGRLQRAREVFTRAVAHVNNVGLLAEEIDPATGEQRLGVAGSCTGIAPHAGAPGESIVRSRHGPGRRLSQVRPVARRWSWGAHWPGGEAVRAGGPVVDLCG